MSHSNSLLGELSSSKVAAVFPLESSAREAANAVASALRLLPAQVRVLIPGQAGVDRALEPESHGIARTIFLAHYKLGIVGLVFGLLVFVGVFVSGVEFVRLSPLAASCALAFFGLVGGLLLGGLVSLRPDHDAYILHAKEALEEGQVVVIVHATSTEQRDKAEIVLHSLGGETTATL